jgi:Na+-transporting methylmalonyl-CoA/oxaloacetate decarboxylase gamma subunit
MTAVDWGQAWQIGGVGFGVVFGILILLAITIWLVGLVLNKISASKNETAEKKKGD